MAGTPTPWAGLRLPAEGDLPDVPADMNKLGADIDALLKLLCTTGPSSSTPVPTTGQNLLNVGPSITTLQSTQSTQAGQITTANTNIAALQTLTAILNNTPWGAVYNPSSGSYSITAPNTTPTAIQSRSIPTATYKRLLVCYSSVAAAWIDGATKTLLNAQTNITIGAQALGPYIGIGQPTVYQVMTSWQLCTIPASTTASVQQTLMQDPSSSATAGKVATTRVGPTDTILMLATLPWSNGPDINLPHF